MVMLAQPSAAVRRSAIHAAPRPTAVPRAVSTSRRIGCCQTSCGLSEATPSTIAVVMPAVTASCGLPSSVAAQTADTDHRRQADGADRQDSR